MKVSALSIDAFAGMPHDADWIALGDRITDANPNRSYVRIEAIVRAAVKLMLDYDISPVVRVGRNVIYVNHFPSRDRVNNVQWLAVPITLERPDVNPFVEARVQNGCANSLRISNKSVLSAFPCIADLSLEIASDILIEGRVIAAQ